MTSSVLTDILLPLSLAIIMFGMGLSLTRFDFLRVWQTPIPILLGLIGQLLLLPLLAFLLATGLDLQPHIAVGIMILAACPGGTMSNLVSHLAKANLALSVTLTAFSSLICVLSAPFIIHFSLNYFTDVQSEQFSLVRISLGLLALTLVPIIIGMIVRHFQREWAIKAEGFFRRFSLIFMIFLVISLLIQEWQTLVDSFSSVFWVCLALNACAILTGWLLAKWKRLSIKDAITLAIEIGLQNSTMAMLIAISFLHMPSYAIAAGVYSVAMYIGAAVIIAWGKFALTGVDHR